ncbi:hypothetical protein LOCC1_G002790 [Lachnellula occidentalis]|uniref:Alternative oxidase n=1 Tax=Lachnellula occidentalis TaxID=215460 RepID=A0A8H8S2T4_9HELO|nr:hypothetical protein LOCC1_G002790 [Lachnellula occidentalis]
MFQNHRYQKQVTEMINGISRIKWWKYRYVLFVALVVNVFVINRFFFDNSISDLNPFGSPATDENLESTTPADPDKTSNGAKTPIVAVEKTKETMTLNLHDYDFNGNYVGWPLERVCKETKWTPGLVYVCDNNSGGIGNIRNFILTCVRYAIEAGSSGLIMPRIQRRSEEDHANLFTTGMQPLSYFFDEAHFKSAMVNHCPQMTIFDSMDNVTNHQNITKMEEFYPKDLNTPDGCDERGYNRHLDHFRVRFDKWLASTNRTPSETKPVSVRFRWATFFEWPIYRDGPEFAATFGDLLRINPDIENIARAVLREFSKFAGIEPKAGKLDVPYLGVHLRTESDALGFWPNFDVQSEGYLKEAEARKLKHAYLACGNATDGHRFGEIAHDRLGMNTTSKLDLLKDEELQALTNLTWDQQALVDYLVLTKSTHFTGCSFSSFTMNIAFKRHTMTDGLHTRQWKSPGDAFTTLVGRFDNWFGDWMFMYECMWP